MKRISLIFLSLILLLTNCSREGDHTMAESGSDIRTTTSAASSDTDPDDCLFSGNYALYFKDFEGKRGIQILHKDRVVYENARPAVIHTVPLRSETEKTSVSGYDGIKKQDGGFLCTAEVTSAQGSVFTVTDHYQAADGLFTVSRTITVSKVGDDRGFSSLFSIGDKSSGGIKDYDYFIPSIIYRDSQYLGTGAVMSSFTTKNYVKETRCGTPLAMMRRKSDGYSIALVHITPEISASEKFNGVSFAISDALKYGAIGFSFTGSASVDFVWPSTETPVSYEASGTVRRYHTVTEENTQRYTLGMIPYKSDLYNDAMVATFLCAMSLCDPGYADVDLEKVYRLNMELYNKLYLKYTGDGGKYSAGYPFAVNVRDFSKFYAVSFQMGFIGSQTEIAAELIREGTKGDADALRKGREILDFWTSDYVYKNKLPPVWWQPSAGGNAGKSTGYPSFLRCFVDGAEGILNACLYAKRAGLDCGRWEKAIVKIADFLVENQNSDGSYYRAYNVDGTVCTDTSSPAYQGTSKLNTPTAVRFLCNMYAYTNDKKYYDAARKAADYCYNELYLGAGKYVGGTPDNPNVPDKEAAIYALYAFSAIYDRTEDEKYYPALQHAAVSVMSWVYTYDYPVVFSLNKEYEQLNIFAEPNTAGWSIIATGHSAIDVFGAKAYYELFRQFQRSGNDGYLKIAGLLMSNTKKAMDLDGSRGYQYGGLALEACNTADMVFFTAENGVWLPWISAAFMEPMIKMMDEYGSYDVFSPAAKEIK